MIKKEKFIIELKNALEIEDKEKKITLETNLKDLEEYDSLSVLSIVAMIDKNFNQQISSSDFANVTTVKSLMDLIGERYFK